MKSQFLGQFSQRTNRRCDIRGYSVAITLPSSFFFLGTVESWKMPLWALLKAPRRAGRGGGGGPNQW